MKLLLLLVVLLLHIILFDKTNKLKSKSEQTMETRLHVEIPEEGSVFLCEWKLYLLRGCPICHVGRRQPWKAVN